VTPTRNVNCSAAVYEDLPTWRTSKNNIDGAIRKLLAQVEALKVIVTTIMCCIRELLTPKCEQWSLTMVVLLKKTYVGTFCDNV
jgi:hypothetical protein